MAKKVKAVVKIQIQGGKANPAPPVGTALGPHGINLMQFCKEYNEKRIRLRFVYLNFLSNLIKI